MSATYRPKKSVVHEQFGDETVIVNLDTGCYYSLQGTADAIWALAACGLDTDAVAAAICEQYTGDADAMANAVSGFLDELLAESLLEAVRNGQSVGERPALAGGTFSPPCLQKYTDMEELLQLDPIHEVDEVGWPSAKTSAV